MPDNTKNIFKFWQELKRRKVIRVITVYAAAAFVILELVSIIIEPLKLPEWFLPMVIVLLCIGFIIAIILSWIYDITPDGIEKTGAIESDSINKKGKNTPLKTWKIASYISFVVIIGLIVLNVIPRTSKGVILDKSIAVLPLEYLSADPSNQYLANGVLDAITGHLSMIEGLRVIPRTSVEQYSENKKSAKEIGEELNVSYLIDGSFLMIGDQVKLTIQLVLAEAGDHVFFKEYDRNYKDIIVVQSEVAQTIVKEIEVAITPEEKQRIEKIPTTNLTAYDFYLRGNEEYSKNLWWSHYDSIANKRAKGFFYDALEYDSTFALAYAGLAKVNLQEQPRRNIDSALFWANKALSYDDHLAEAYTARGSYYFSTNNLDQARRDYEKAIKLNPNDWMAYRRNAETYRHVDGVKSIKNIHIAASLHHGPYLPYLYKNLCRIYEHYGFPEKVIYYNQEARKLDRDSADYFYWLGIAEYFQTGNIEKANEYFKKGYARDSIDFNILDQLCRTYMYLGQHEEALKYYKRWEEMGIIRKMYYFAYVYWQLGYKEEAEKIFTEIIIGPSYNQALASVYAFRGEKDKAYKYLRIWNQSRQIALFYDVFNIKHDPLLESIRDEPEFQQFLQDVEAKYQAEHERIRQWLEEQQML
jgi:TolB-like protein/Tfp pilus assembly protein PilF